LLGSGLLMHLVSTPLQCNYRCGLAVFGFERGIMMAAPAPHQGLISGEITSACRGAPEQAHDYLGPKTQPLCCGTATSRRIPH
jgi:hypothetical protein